MIVVRTWERKTSSKYGLPRHFHYVGWFLLGFIPLFVVRTRIV